MLENEKNNFSNYFLSKLFIDDFILERFTSCLYEKINIDGEFIGKQIGWCSKNNITSLKDVEEFKIIFNYKDTPLWKGQVSEILFFYKNERTDNNFYYSPNSKYKKIIDSVIKSYIREFKINDILC